MNQASIEYKQTNIQIVANSARYEGEYVIFVALIQFLKMVSLIYFIVSEIKIFTKFR